MKILHVKASVGHGITGPEEPGKTIGVMGRLSIVSDFTPIERSIVDTHPIIPLSVWIGRGVDRLK